MRRNIHLVADEVARAVDEINARLLVVAGKCRRVPSCARNSRPAAGRSPWRPRWAAGWDTDMLEREVDRLASECLRRQVTDEVTSRRVHGLGTQGLANTTAVGGGRGFSYGRRRRRRLHREPLSCMSLTLERIRVGERQVRRQTVQVPAVGSDIKTQPVFGQRQVVDPQRHHPFG
jgi:hypothetical protein